jgi:hypothetical protein
MCPTCDRLRDVDTPAGSGQLVCAQCGRVSTDGRGFRADVVPDYADEGEEPDAPELLAWCGECWQREFGE